MILTFVQHLYNELLIYTIDIMQNFKMATNGKINLGLCPRLGREARWTNLYPARMFMSEDFPAPLGPMMAVNCPEWK